MLWAIGFLVTFLFGGLTGIILSARPLDFQLSDSLLRRRALPLRGLRHRGVRDVRRLLLLVAQADRPDARRAARQGALLDAVHRLPHDVPHPALARRRGHAAPLRRLPARGRLHRAATRSPPSARSSSAPRCCRSSTTSGRRGATRRMVDGRRPVGLRRARWSGRPPARRRGTTSPRCRASAPSGPLSTCTTRRSRGRGHPAGQQLPGQLHRRAAPGSGRAPRLGATRATTGPASAGRPRRTGEGSR